MWWTIIGIACLVVGAWLMEGVLVKKFPQLKLIDLSTLAKERHEQVKSRIMKDRFERSMGRLQSKTQSAFGGLLAGLRSLFDRAHGSLKRMEAGIEARTPRGPEEAAARLALCLSQAQAAAGEGHHEEAEKLYIEVLKLDPKHVEAYRGLAEVYIAQKLPDQAAETLEFLLRIGAGDDRTLGRLGDIEASRGNLARAEARYLESIGTSKDATAHRGELGRVYLAMGEPQKAFEQFRTALQEEPYNPKYLDYFLEASILVGDAETAEEALRGLETVNPGNAKLEDFRERIEEMRAAAEARASID
jgi:tetratricopeptide (TPR) repeat protein